MPAAFARGPAGEAAGYIERLLSLGLFDRGRLTVPVGRLATGQLRRPALARLLSEPSDILLPDEPTNHLPPLVEELEAAPTGYEGALVIVAMIVGCLGADGRPPAPMRAMATFTTKC